MALRREFARFLALEATRIVGMDMMDWIGQRTGKIRLKQELQRWEKCEMYMQMGKLQTKENNSDYFPAVGCTRPCRADTESRY
jgi:hypothetical protein